MEQTRVFLMGKKEWGNQVIGIVHTRTGLTARSSLSFLPIGDAILSSVFSVPEILTKGMAAQNTNELCEQTCGRAYLPSCLPTEQVYVGSKHLPSIDPSFNFNSVLTTTPSEHNTRLQQSGPFPFLVPFLSGLTLPNSFLLVLAVCFKKTP